MTPPSLPSVPEVGAQLATATYHLTRESLVRYAGASGDFNPIHYRDDIAAQVGLPGVLAHGMLTMGISVQPIIEWVGDPGRIVDYQTRFSRPVVVDAAAGADLEVRAVVGTVESETAEIRVDLTVTCNGQTVLAKAQVRVSLA